MEQNVDNTIVITDENGNEEVKEILFTFEADNGKNFLVCFDEITEDDGEEYTQLYYFYYDPNDNGEGELLPVTDESDIMIIEEMIQNFLDEEEDEESEEV